MFGTKQQHARLFEWIEIFDYQYLSSSCLVIPSSQPWAEAGYHHKGHDAHEESRSVVKNRAGSSGPFFVFFFASIGHSGFPASEDRNLPDSGTFPKR